MTHASLAMVASQRVFGEAHHWRWQPWSHHLPSPWPEPAPHLQDVLLADNQNRLVSAALAMPLMNSANSFFARRQQA